jgi:hypothetical protein
MLQETKQCNVSNTKGNMKIRDCDSIPDSIAIDQTQRHARNDDSLQG